MSASLGAGQYVAVSPFVQLIISNGERRAVTTALLDNGCETSLITQELASVLELRGPRMQLRLRTFHGIDPALTAWITSCQISSCFDKTSSFVIPRLMAVPELRVTPRIINWPVEKRRWPHLSNLNISHFDWREVGMFIGMNVPAAFRQIDFRPHPTGSGPDAVLTPFGWAVQGLVDASSVILPSTQSSECHAISPEGEDDGFIEKMWAVEDKCGSKDDKRALMKQKDEDALVTYRSTVILKGNRYEIGIPFISPSARVPNNYKAAVRRLYAVESRFKSDSQFAFKYTKAIEMYEELGFARKLQRHELIGPEGRTWYLPHFMVVHPAKPEKPRLVFDAAARHRGVCLNDVLHSGPVMLVNLHELLIRFRENPVGISMDIEKMFLQIRVREQDQPVFRFLWRRPGSKGPPIAYQMLVVVFGAASSPTTSAFILHRTVDDNPKYSDVGERVKTNFYVDNYLDSFESAEEASFTCKRLK